MEPVKVHLADGRSMDAVGKGLLGLSNTDGDALCRFKEVWFIPELGRNLISVSQLTKTGAKVKFDDLGCSVAASDGREAFRARKEGGLYLFSPQKSEKANSATAESRVTFTRSLESSNLQLWHQRLGHLNTDSIKKLAKISVGLHLDDPNKDLGICETCAIGKITRSSFPKGKATRASELLGIIHSDVCGPMQTTTFGGAKYFVTFIDDCSRVVTIYLLKQKSEAFEAFKSFEAWATTYTGKRIKILRSDPGGEYMSNKFRQHLSERGILHQKSVTDTPQQNGVAERMNRTLVEMARCLLTQAGLENRFWGEAINTAAYLRNRAPSAALKSSTPFEIFTGNKPDLSKPSSFWMHCLCAYPQEKPL